VDQVNQNLAGMNRSRNSGCFPATFSEETGELTPTQKMKRRVIHEKYGREIETLYQ
jgi:long-chain acyl-CoA synthetase